MTPIAFLDHLDLVEQQFNEVAVVLAESNPARLEMASAALHRLASELVELLRTAHGGEAVRRATVQRLKALSQGTLLLRSQLHRRVALVEQALKVVMPSEPVSTYSDGGPYGSAMRQSGAFKVLAA
ncbi:MAG: hypothetical protein KGN32_12300 [Burkholderiales bacterium]|nr:hypothetical protein [Burkholderiales bacterium]